MVRNLRDALGNLPYLLWVTYPKNNAKVGIFRNFQIILKIKTAQNVVERFFI
jgi:hypothetical protein